MHDPLIVAFTIRRPWPQRSNMITGKRWYWPPLVTVWHREPRGHDSGEICGYRRRNWHVHHWRLQVHPLQSLRRSLLTRCAWCGGRSTKTGPVNFSHTWDGPCGHWWQGEPGLFHEDCSAVKRAHQLCLCPEPLLKRSDSGFGDCLTCGRFHPWRHQPDDADRLLAALPEGSRITPDVRPSIETAWEQRRAAKVGADLDQRTAFTGKVNPK